MSGFDLRKSQRTAAFIDGPNLYSAGKALSCEVDFKKLRSYLSENSELIRMYYYTAVREDDETQAIYGLLDWLEYNGYHVVTKPTKEFTDAMGRRKIKGSLDVEIAVDVMEMSSRLDHVILFTGDGAFRALVENIQKRGCKVSVVSDLSMVADELRRQTDHFVDLRDIYPIVGRDPAHREAQLPSQIVRTPIRRAT
jgi:uncharacterized LabA/DUF88 family protein